MESSICLWIRNELILEFVIFAIVYFIGGFIFIFYYGFYR